ANLADIEDIALVQRENRFKILAFEGKAFLGIGAANYETSHVILRTLFNGDSDVRGFATLTADERKRPQALAIHVDGGQYGILDNHLEVSGALIKIADAGFEIHVELGAIESLVQYGHIEKQQGNGDRPGIVHGSYDLAIGERVIALEGN